MYLGKIHRSLGKENINNFEPLDYDAEKEKIPTFLFIKKYWLLNLCLASFYT